MINIVLYEPEIPGNTGNIMRTCAGTNTILHLIKPLGFSLEEKSIKRSAVNYLENCEYYVYENYQEFCDKNKGEFFFLTRYGKVPHSNFNFKEVSKKIYLIFGKESTGVPKEILKENIERCFRIPTNSNIRSLNLSNAVNITLFEVLRQLDYPGLSLTEIQKGSDYLDK